MMTIPPASSQSGKYREKSHASGTEKKTRKRVAEKETGTSPSLPASLVRFFAARSVRFDNGKRLLAGSNIS